MPNPLGRRRGGENAEVAQLKKELDELRAIYQRDISLIGGDIRDLDTRISSAASAEGTPNPVLSDISSTDTPDV